MGRVENEDGGFDYLPSDVESVQRTYALTSAEAERVLDEVGVDGDKESAAERVRSERTTLVTVTEEREAGEEVPVDVARGFDERGDAQTVASEDSDRPVDPGVPRNELLPEGTEEVTSVTKIVRTSDATSDDVASDETEEDPFPDDEYGVDDLKEEARKRDLPVSGNKQELKDRIVAHDRGEAE